MEQWGKYISFNKCFGKLHIHKEINKIGCFLHVQLYKNINFRHFVDLNKKEKAIMLSEDHMRKYHYLILRKNCLSNKE